jgi:hypothetical protein
VGAVAANAAGAVIYALMLILPLARAPGALQTDVRRYLLVVSCALLPATLVALAVGQLESTVWQIGIGVTAAVVQPLLVHRFLPSLGTDDVDAVLEQLPAPLRRAAQRIGRVLPDGLTRARLP